MIASRQVEVLVDSVEGDSVHMHKLLGEDQFYLYVKMQPRSKIIADLLECAAPDIAEVASGRKNFKTAAEKAMPWETIGSGSKQRIIPAKTTNEASPPRWDNFKKDFSVIISSRRWVTKHSNGPLHVSPWRKASNYP